ncbi:MAG: hypothetical protein ACOY4Q_00340 [Bacillota bacterium]
MKSKRKILIFVLVALFSIIPTAAYASVFYDLFGDTNLTWISSGVNVFAQSWTDDTVDLIKVSTETYVNGVYQGTIYNSKVNASDVYINMPKSFFGYVLADTTHNAIDWTGDEITYSADSMSR